MAYEFNVFSAPVEAATSTRIKFAAGPGMPAGAEIWIEGTDLTHDANTGLFTGTITGLKLFDPNAGGVGVGDVVQTIAMGSNPLAQINAFVTGAAQVFNDFNTFGVFDFPFDHLGPPQVLSGGTVAVLELLDGSENVLGSIRLNGTNFDQSLGLDGPGALSTVSSIGYFSAGGNLLNSVDYTGPDPITLAQLSYGLVRFGIDGMGDLEEIYAPFVGGGVSISSADAYNYVQFEGGTGSDNFVTNIGGFVHYENALAAVTVDLGAGTATGGGGSDAWAPGSIAGVAGSMFNDTLTGGSFGSSIRGEQGDDSITGGASHDRLEGGIGNDTINGGNGDDWLFAGAGDDEIIGGFNDGTDTAKGSLAFDDALVYSRIITNNYDAIRGPDFDFAAEAANMTNGITFTLTGSGTGTAVGVDIGNDTFTGIEVVYGSKLNDVFNANVGLGATNIFIGMDGADTFNGSVQGFEFVSYQGEILDPTKYRDIFINRVVTPSIGVAVNLGEVAQTIGGGTLAAGTAVDFFGSTDTFGGDIDGVGGTFFSDALIGNSLNNVIIGFEGADLLVGRQGNDDLSFGNLQDNAGGSLADYVDYRRDGGTLAIEVTVAADGVATVTDTWGDVDTVHGFGNFVGTDLDDLFTGHAGLNRFTGGRGNDTYVSGGSLGQGNLSDQISYLFDDNATVGIVFDASGVNGYNTTITTNDPADFWGTDTLSGYTSIYLEGTQNADSLKGGSGDDIFAASLGADTIDGGGGIDALSYVDFRTSLDGDGVVYNADTSTSGNVTDAGGITDTYTNIELLAGSMNNDTFSGSAGNDLFAGHGGNDIIQGNGGNDTITYAFDAALAFALGIDLKRLALDTGRNAPAAPPHGIIADLAGGFITGIFDDLNTEFTNEDSDTVSGIANVIGTDFADEFIGDDQNNRFEGGLGSDTLQGGLGDDELIGGDDADTLVGGAGNDTLDGGNGIDSMSGGADNDLYFVGSLGDIVVEDADAGVDTITTRVEILALAANVENIVMRAVADFTGSQSTAVGNELANAITGNDAGNRLDGGADNLVDTLTGRLGNDTYVVSANDVIVEALGGGTLDRVLARESFTLAADDNIEILETILATATTSINLTGNGLAQTINGNAGANLIDGGAGIDTMAGGAGNDTFVVGTGDIISDTAGTDVARAASTYVLAANIAIETLETVNAAATTAINLTGNNLANKINGNAGANLIDGGAGIDTMAGGAGNDTFVVGTGDIISDTAGTDVARASSSYVLAANVAVETLETVSAAAITAINLTGNNLLNKITGNAGGNILSGGVDALADTLTGLGGNDTYLINSVNDNITESAGQGTADRARASVSFALATGDNIEFLETVNAAALTALNLTGNEIAQTVTGNNGSNIINGGLGNDTLAGGLGNDFFVFNTALGASNIDRITDFNVAADTIRLENTGTGLFNALPVGVLALAAFNKGAGFISAKDATDRIIYNTTTGDLYYDKDGLGGAAAIKFATIFNKAALTNADFIII